MTTPLLHIENRLHALLDELRSAYSHYSALQAIYDAANRGSRLLQHHTLFYAITLGAHNEAVFSSLFRMVDRRAGAIGIEGFLRFVNRHADALPYGAIKVVEQRVARDLTILNEVEPQLRGLRERRNKVGAHVSLQVLPYLGRQIEAEFPLNYTDIEAVLQEFDFILGHYYEFCRGEKHVPTAYDQFFYTDAVNEVLQIINGE